MGFALGWSFSGIQSSVPTGSVVTKLAEVAGLIVAEPALGRAVAVVVDAGPAGVGDLDDERHAARGSDAVGVITSLFAGHWVPSSESCWLDLVDISSGLQAGGSGLFCGPPTGFSCEASCALGSGSF